MRNLRRSGQIAALVTALALLAAVTPADAAPADQDGPAGPAISGSSVVGPIHQNDHVDARDNGQSVLYRGQSMWFFDDTILQNPSGFLTSTAAVTKDLDASDGIDLTSSTVFDRESTGEPTDFVPFTAAEQQFQDQHAADDCSGSDDEYCGAVFGLWPGGAAVDPARHRILVSYLKLCRGGQVGTLCESGFVGHSIGAGFVQVDPRTGTATRLAAKNQTTTSPGPEGDDSTMFFSADEDWGGAGMVRDGNKLYLYGKCTLDGCGVARAPLDAFQDMATWRYYAGDHDGNPVWATDPDDAAVIVGNGGAGGTINQDKLLGGYVHTYMPFLSQDVLYQTASHPWGPWSKPAVLFTAPKTDGTEYAAYAHPEYDQNGGHTKYYSYYTSSTGDQMLVRVDFAAKR